MGGNTGIHLPQCDIAWSLRTYVPVQWPFVAGGTAAVCTSLPVYVVLYNGLYVCRLKLIPGTDMIRTYVELRVEPQLQSCDTIYHCRARYPMDTLWHTTNPSTGTTLVALGHSKGRHEGVATPEQAPRCAHQSRMHSNTAADTRVTET